MKKILFMLAVMALPLMAHAQKAPNTITIYPRIGVNWSKFSGDKIYYAYDAGSMDQTADSKYRAGFTAGAEVQYQFTNTVAASIGALYSRQGSDYEDLPAGFGKSPSVKTDNILVPVLLVGTTNFGLSVKAGVQADFCVNDDDMEAIRKVGLSIPIGLAYEWNHIVLDARYNIGVTKVFKSYYGDDQHNSTFLVTLGYGFDL